MFLPRIAAACSAGLKCLTSSLSNLNVFILNYYPIVLANSTVFFLTIYDESDL